MCTIDSFGAMVPLDADVYVCFVSFECRYQMLCGGRKSHLSYERI